MKLYPLTTVVSACFALANSPAVAFQAEVVQWNTSAGGPFQFQSPSNWVVDTPQGPIAKAPDGDDVALFDVGTAVIVTAPGSSTTTPGVGTCEPQGASNAVGQLVFNSGTTVLRGGALHATESSLEGSRSLHVARDTGTVATLIVDDFTLVLDEVADLARGPGSQGTLIVEGADALVRTNANCSGWFAIGSVGHGELIVREGARVVTSRTAIFGDFSAGVGGDAVVTGAGTSWESGAMLVGHRAGTSTLEVSSAGEVIVDERFWVGVEWKEPGSGFLPVVGEVVVHGTGSRVRTGYGVDSWTGRVDIGRDGDGRLEVTDGASFETHGRFRVGGAVTSAGAVVVDGFGSRLWIEADTGPLAAEIGKGGVGTLDISQGGRVDAALLPFAIGTNGGAGTVRLSGEGSELSAFEVIVNLAPPSSESEGSRLIVEEGAVVAASFGVAVLDQGRLELEGGRVNGTVVVEGGGSAVGHGDVLANVINRGLLRVDGGSTDPLSLDKALTVGGRLELHSTGVLEVALDLQDPTGAQAPRIHVADTAQLGGTLRVSSPLSSVGPEAICDGEWLVMTALDFDGAFAAVEAVEGQFPPGTEFETHIDDVGLWLRARRSPELAASTTLVSAANGGTVEFAIESGSCAADALYILLGSTATVPGQPIGDVVLPLAPSPYFDFLLSSASSAYYAGKVGGLDPDGEATIVLTVPPGSTALAGVLVFHAALTVQEGVVRVTAPLPLFFS